MSVGSTVETELTCTLYDREEFLGLFSEPVDIPVNARSMMKLSVLQVENGDFILDRFYNTIADASLAYVLSRVDLAKVNSLPVQKMGSVFEDVKSRFQTANGTNAEGGEILLYALLEAVLSAPKLLSKMELKTSNQMPVFGADGVHLLKVKDGAYQLIFGEAKMYGSLKDALKSAFQSMDEIRGKAFRDDLSLVSTQILKEAVNQEQLDVLESILLPSKEDASRVILTKSFGVLVGFDLDVSEIDISSLTDGGLTPGKWTRRGLAMLL